MPNSFSDMPPRISEKLFEYQEKYINMKKVFYIIGFILLHVSMLCAQSNNKIVVPNDTSAVVVLKTIGLQTIRGNIVAQRGDTILLKTQEEGIVYILKKNLQSIMVISKTNTTSPTKNARTQPTIVLPICMLKVGAIIVPILSSAVFGVFDAGIEFKLKDRLTFELSGAIRKYETEHQYSRKVVWATQLRYYGTKNQWQSSPYLGILAQYHTEYHSIGDVSVDENTYLSKWGTGIIAGKHIKMGKRLGLDVHCGNIWQKGLYRKTDLATHPATIIETNKWSNRVFAGLNLYIVL